SGPETEEFAVNTGQLLEAEFNCGNFCNECSYIIYDNEGNVIFEDGMNGEEPTGEEVGMADCSTYTNEVMTLSIDIYAGYSGIKIPKSTVKNNGTTTQTFNVTITIGDSGYSSTKTVSELGYMETSQVEFDPWNAVGGMYTVECCTELEGDENPENDCLSKDIDVEPLNIVYGYNVYDPSGALDEGPVWFDASNPQNLNLISPTPSEHYISSACQAFAQWFGIEYGTGTIYMISTAGGSMQEVGSTGITMHGLAYDESSSTMYGVGDGNLYAVSPFGGSTTLIGAHNAGRTIISLACDGYGGIYGHSVSEGTDDNLYSFDPETGQATLVGSLGISCLNAQDAAFDKATGNLYIAAYLENGDGKLYYCDKNTAELTLIGDFKGGAEIDGFVCNVSNTLVPNLLSAEPGFESVTLTWEYGTGSPTGNTLKVDENFLGEIRSGKNTVHLFDTVYNVYYADGTLVAEELHDTVYTDTALEGGTQYCYYITQSTEWSEESGPSNALCAMPFSSQNIELAQGYNFVSSYFIPDNPDMLYVTQDILGNLDFIRDENGNTVQQIGSEWINNIGDWSTTGAYLFRMNDPDNLSMQGDYVNQATPITLNAGFNFAPYLLTEPMDALQAFNSIIDNNLDFIRNEDGNMLRKIGPNWINNIGDARPGEGYLVKMNGSGVLVYPNVK
ncbi:MAG: hypothetical protein K9I94_12645, partial [Bacteroidales bacterium]|nr:hypothetical protein [Bacteroidales bacterium]